MLSCKEVVKIVSSDEPTSWKQQLEIRLHLYMCHHCRKFFQQLKSMKMAFKNLLKRRIENQTPDKVKQIEDQILAKLINKP